MLVVLKLVQIRHPYSTVLPVATANSGLYTGVTWGGHVPRKFVALVTPISLSNIRKGHKWTKVQQEKPELWTLG